MKTLRLVFAASFLAAPALGQTVTDPKTMKSTVNGQPAVQGTPAAQPPADNKLPGPMKALQPMPIAINPPFARLAEVGPDGKVIRVDGNLDLLAIPRNTYVDQACRDRIRPLVKAWMADVDQLAIDNLDFLEKIEPSDGTPGIIDRANINDQPGLHQMAQMMTMLMAAGPLSNHLEMKEGFTREQSQRNQEIVSDYLQQVMNELMRDAGVPNEKGADLNDQQKLDQVNAVSRFLYGVSCRDTVDSFHRQMSDAAAILDQAVGSLGLPAGDMSKLGSLIEAAKTAKTAKEKRAATRAVLDKLTFDQRRAVLTKSLAILGPCDPIASLGPAIPPPPNAGQPVAAPGAAAPAVNPPAAK